MVGTIWHSSHGLELLRSTKPVVGAANTDPFEARAGQRSVLRFAEPDKDCVSSKTERVRYQRPVGQPFPVAPLAQKSKGRSTGMAVHISGVRSGNSLYVRSLFEVE